MAEIVSLLYDLVDDINIAQELALIRIASRILSIFKTIYNANHYSRNLIGSTMPCVTNSLSIGNTENDLFDIMNYSSLLRYPTECGISKKFAISDVFYPNVP